MKFLKQGLVYHILPLIIALLAAYYLLSSKAVIDFYTNNQTPTNTYFQDSARFYNTRHLPNYADSVWAELIVAQSLKNKHQLTVFGSSELSGADAVCYNFLRDSLHQKVFGLGHAYNELFAIYCQLLRMQPYLQNSKISIILSPGWFSDGLGTNPQAFLEFVPPHFISHIFNNKSIQTHHKKYVSRVFHDQYANQISGPRLEYQFLNTSYLFPFLNKYKQALPLKYQLNLLPDFSNEIKDTTANDKWIKWLNDSQQASLATLNEYYVDSSYFKTYLTKSNGDKKISRFKNISVKDNVELQDLKMVLQLLKENNCEVSFVMQPFNTHFYENCEAFDPLLTEINKLMTAYGFEDNYLNLFKTNKEDYTPGILIDVMHFSNFGWITVNKFLYEQHFN